MSNKKPSTCHLSNRTCTFWNGKFPYNAFIQCHSWYNTMRKFSKLSDSDKKLPPSPYTVCVLRPGVVSWDWPLQAQLRHSATPSWLHGDTEEPSMQLPNAPQAERLRWESDEARILLKAPFRNKHTDFLAWGCFIWEDSQKTSQCWIFLQ